MARAAIYDFTLGDKTMAELGVEHLVESIVFEEEAGKFDKVTLKLKSGPEMAECYSLLKHGAVFQLSLGCADVGLFPMMLGFHKGCKPTFDKKFVEIYIYSYPKVLDVGEKDRVLQNRTILEVVQEIVADYNPLIVGTIDNGDLIISETSTQSKQTDLQFLENIAKKFGMKWTLESTDTAGVWALSLKKIGFSSKEVSEKYPTLVMDPDKQQQKSVIYRHLKVFSPESNILGVSSTVNILSNNPNSPINVNSKKYSSDKYISEARGSEIVFSVFGTVQKVHFYENLSDEEAAQFIADAMLEEDELRFVSAKGCQLKEGDPHLRVGQLREIIPNAFPPWDAVFKGKYTIIKTVHKIDSRSSYTTSFDCGRHALSLPAPPELGFGSGGGRPVLIVIYTTGYMHGWYVSFTPEGHLSILPGCIGHEEILANSPWMNRIFQYTPYVEKTKIGVMPVFGTEVPMTYPVEYELEQLYTKATQGADPIHYGTAELHFEQSESPLNSMYSHILSLLPLEHPVAVVVPIGWPPDWPPELGCDVRISANVNVTDEGTVEVLGYDTGFPIIGFYSQEYQDRMANESRNQSAFGGVFGGITAGAIGEGVSPPQSPNTKGVL